MDDQSVALKYIPNHFSYRAKRAATILVSQRDLLLSGYGTDNFETKSNPNDILTEIDTKVEKNLKIAFANIDENLQGEELGYDPNLSDPFWICDPIDGTGCYVRQQPFCVSMIAYIVDGEVEIGLIYDFLADQLYAAERGKGAFCNTKPVHVSNRGIDELKGSVSGSYIDNAVNSMRIYLKSHHMNRYNVYAAGNEFFNVANGKNDIKICVNAGNMDWDRAPGMLLIREAGGVYKRLDGKDASYRENTFIATNPIAYKQIISDPQSPFYLGDT
jgi:myo-inositol-1(or 4)-monophosphatase